MVVRQSQLFTKTERSSPKDETSINAKLLIRGGFIRKMSAGIYAYLPLGWRVATRVMQVIREEMNAIGGTEMFMPALIEKKYLDATNRWDVPIGFRVDTYTGGDDNNNGGKNERHDHNQKSSFVLGWTHEEILTEIASHYVNSHRDLPFAAYQFQTKFRNELRVQSGLLRGREFIMKDLYSFHATEDDLARYYAEVRSAYEKIFARVGVNAIYTLAAGGDFTTGNTHEFQAISPVGEDTIFVCSKCEYAENKEISRLTDGVQCPSCGGSVKEAHAIEVGNIFPLGTKYADAFGLKFKDAHGESHPVVMGSYGIGIGRLIATIVEMHHDDKGIIWPASVAPFAVHLVALEKDLGKSLYEKLAALGIEVLYDDREVSAGEKFGDADLLGIPLRAVVSKKTEGKIELKSRVSDELQLVSEEDFLKRFARTYAHESI